MFFNGITEPREFSDEKDSIYLKFDYTLIILILLLILLY